MKKVFFAGALVLTCAATSLAATEYNGDKIDGVPVITRLDVADLAPGKHRFMFKGADMNLGQSYYVPVMVAKGQKPGKRLLLNTGIHGDELNGSRVVQKVFDSLDPAKLSGAVVGVVQASPGALMHVNRKWYLSTDGGDLVDMNRIMPGKPRGNTAEVHADKLWSNLWNGNADQMIDLHTQSTDTEYPVFIYADYRMPEVQRLAELIPADQIKADPGSRGNVEGEFVFAKIPAITLEMGNGRVYEPERIDRAVEGINNVLIDMQMIDGKMGRTAKTFGTYIGNDMTSIRASRGGYAEIMVKIGDNVKKGEKVAVQRNPFGDVIQEYTATRDGKVLSTGTGATREAGALLVRILNQNPDPLCEKGC